METSTIDYTISCDDIEELETIRIHKGCKIYIGRWRFKTVCVKELQNNKDIDNELVVLSKCIHPNIVQFLGAETTTTKTSIVFEYMKNGTLSDYLKGNKVNMYQKIIIMIDVMIALNYLHNRKPDTVLHRDLKPDNILVNVHGQVKIADFGISKMVEGTNKEMEGHTGETGTYVWMSPEVLKHEPYNYKADMYSVGLIIYFIWTEEIPFKNHNMNTIQIMFSKFRNELKLKKTHHIQLDDIIDRCCAYDMKIRPDSNVVITELQKILLHYI